MIVTMICLVIGVLGILWFSIPLVLHNILNIGNATGIIVGIIIILYGISHNRIIKFCKQQWDATFGKLTICFVAGIVGVILCLVIVITGCMLQSIRKQPTDQQVAIVLGCRVYGERPSIMLQERIDAAYEYLQENEEAYCILSGGKGIRENISEAECMYRGLVAKGIDENRLYKEEKSTSTRENLLYSYEIIKQQNWSRTLAIVTSEFHEYRAGKIATSLGLESTSIPARTKWWLFPTYYVRELYGILYEWVF